MSFENLGIQLAFGIGLGGLTALLGWLADTKPWSHKLLGYTMAISTITALGVVNGFDGGVITGDNALSLILMVLGASFVVNKSQQIGQRLNPKK